jgi:hypothetical protein
VPVSEPGQATKTSPQVNADSEKLAAAHADARARAESGDLTGARTLLEDALAVGEVRLGHSHPRLAPLMVDLATIARNLGNLTEARTQLRRAYAIIVSASGPEHATALSIEGRLAAVTSRLGEPTEAYDWHLADVGARVLGTEHPAVRGAGERLAAAQEIQETYAREAAAAHAASLVEPEQIPATYLPALNTPGVYERVPELPEPNQGGWAPQTYDDLADAEGIYVVEPPPREYQDVEVWREPPLDRRSRRGHGGGVAVVASLGAAILIGAAVVAVQLFGPGRGPAPGAGPSAPIETASAATPTVPAPQTSPSPTNVTIQDNGGSVTLTWVDPSGGKVPFIVAGGRDGAPSGPLETVPAGRTTSTIYGLNVNYNYCYTVTAVWSSEMIAPSIRTCTRRLATSGAAAVSLGESTA